MVFEIFRSYALAKGHEKIMADPYKFRPELERARKEIKRLRKENEELRKREGETLQLFLMAKLNEVGK